MTDAFRQVYTPVTDEAKGDMLAIKIKAQELWDLFDAAEKKQTETDGSVTVTYDTRMLRVAKTELETAVMWAIKGLTA